jgi:hypothetical protein
MGGNKMSGGQKDAEADQDFQMEMLPSASDP